MCWENGKLKVLCLLPLASTRNWQLFASSIQLLEVGNELSMLLNMDKGSLLPQWNGHWDGVGWHMDSQYLLHAETKFEYSFAFPLHLLRGETQKSCCAHLLSLHNATKMNVVAA